jgi:excisionase family DNA binding protein
MLLVSNELIIDPARTTEAEWSAAIARYVRQAKEAGEMVALQSRPEFLTPEQAGQRLGMSRTTIVRAINAGEITAVKVGNRHRILAREVDRYRAQLFAEALAEVSEGVDFEGPVPDDSVAVYDIMREAANRLTALYVPQITAGGAEDPAIIAMRAISKEVDAVAWNDIAAQKAMTAELDRRYAELRR